MSFRRPNRLPVTQALVTGVLILFSWTDAIASAVTSCPRIGVVTLPSPAPGTRVFVWFQRKYRQPCVTPPCTGPYWKLKPSR